MTAAEKTAFETIKAGLEDAQAYKAGDKSRARVVSPSILSQAQETVQDRHERYGDCTQVMAATNEMFRIYQGLKGGASNAHDTAVFNIIQKLVRIGSGQAHQDNWIDIAGYASLGAEVADDGQA